MKYNIGDNLFFENKIKTIIDFEQILGKNIYYMSDNSSYEESQLIYFKVFDDIENDKFNLFYKNHESNFKLSSHDAIIRAVEKFHNDLIQFEKEEKIKRKKNSIFNIFSNIIYKLR